MVTSSLIKHLFCDDESLKAYFYGMEVSFTDVKRRMLLAVCKENRTIPDHHYRLIQENSFNKIESIADTLRLGLYNLAKEHLHLKGNRIHVLQEKQTSWQQLITYIPPLVLQAAFLQFVKPFDDDTPSGSIKYYNEFILPNTKYTALPYPFIPQLEHYIESKEGLHDLHMHLNGSTETDNAWQDFLHAPEDIYTKLSTAYRNQKVKEQFEQESQLLEPKIFVQLLYVARSIRELLFDFIFPEQANKPFAMNLKSVLYSLLNERDDKYTGTHIHPFSKLVNRNNDYPFLMSVEALMYVLVFRYLCSKPNETVASLFHFYLLILGLSNRLLVQQTHQYGFEQFQKLTLNGLRETSEREYEKRFFQIHGNDLRNINFLEGRFSPKESESKTLDLLIAIDRGWCALLKHAHIEFINQYSIWSNKTEYNWEHYRNYEITKPKIEVNLPRLKLISHFIKEEDKNFTRVVDNKHDVFIQHKELRYSVWQKGVVLSSILKNYQQYREKIIGADAASSEFDTPPEVFAPVFRMLRRKGMRHFTYHAGEDFHHIISGLRAIYEAVDFTDLKNGDRIGHATACGISAIQWVSIMGQEIFIRQGEWLDNLIFTYHLIISENLTNLNQYLPIIANNIQEYAYKIYEDYFPVNVLIDAWKLRKYCPVLVFSKDKHEAETHSVFDEDEWCEIQNTVRSMNNMKSVFKFGNRLWVAHNRYHSIDYSKAYNEIISVKTEEIFNITDIELLQIGILKFMHKKEIVIETLPTSNVRIGHHTNYSTYHLWNWIKWEKEGKDIPPIVAGTDDTGIFATNIYNEYANIYCYLTQEGKVTHNEAMKIIERLDKNGQIYRFE